MSKFKVGDRVRIREWKDMEKQFGLDEMDNIACRLAFASGMRALCGRKATIVAIHEPEISLGSYSDTDVDWEWAFSIDMIELVGPEEDVVEASIEDSLWLNSYASTILDESSADRLRKIARKIAPS